MRGSCLSPTAAGMLWVTLGTFSFSLVVALGKLAGIEARAPTLQIVFLRYLGGLLSMLVIAAEMILIRSLAVRDSAVSVLFFVNLLASLLLLGPTLAVWRPLSGLEFVGLLFLGPLAIAAQYFNIRGYRLANASLLGPVAYSRLIFAAALGLLLFGEEPTLITLLGSAIIIVGGSMLARQDNNASPTKTKKKE